MARYIDAERLKGFLRLDQSGTEDTLKHGTHLHPVRKLELKAYIGAIEYCVNEINEAPTADVVEVTKVVEMLCKIKTNIIKNVSTMIENDFSEIVKDALGERRDT